MLDRTKFFTDHPRFEDGTEVYSRDGEYLGKVESMEDDYFVVSKGFFFPKEFTARFSDVEQVEDDRIVINQDKNELAPWREESYAGWSEYENRNRIDDTARNLREGERDIRVPVVEEKLEVEKVRRETGQVRLRKIVHTELKHITVPITKEEVRVERVPVNEERDLAPGEASFKDETISVPTMEEDVRVVKRPVVKEEVRVRRDVRTEDRDVSEEVRRQDVEVEGKDEERLTTDRPTRRRTG